MVNLRTETFLNLKWCLYLQGQAVPKDGYNL